MSSLYIHEKALQCCTPCRSIKVISVNNLLVNFLNHSYSSVNNDKYDLFRFNIDDKVTHKKKRAKERRIRTNFVIMAISGFKNSDI